MSDKKDSKKVKEEDCPNTGNKAGARVSRLIKERKQTKDNE